MAQPVSEILPDVERKSLDYRVYRRTAKDCDILLWEPRRFYGHVVALATDGPFSHVSAAVWWESRLMSVGYDEKRGGVAVPLKTEVYQNPGCISVFRVRGKLDRHNVRNELIDSLGHRYEWGLIVRFGWLAFPVVKLVPRLRRFAERFVADSPGAFCSQYIHRAFLKGGEGMYLCRKSSFETTPNDLGRSAILDYLGTLE